jgi:hypothetical protein
MGADHIYVSGDTAIVQMASTSIALILPSNSFNIHIDFLGTFVVVVPLIVRYVL